MGTPRRCCGGMSLRTGPGDSCGEHRGRRPLMAADRAWRGFQYSSFSLAGYGHQVSASVPAGGIYKPPELGTRRWVICRSRLVVCWQCMTERAERPARPAARQPIGRKSQIAANARPPALLCARPGPRVTGVFASRPSVRPGNMRDRRWMRPADGARSPLSALSHCPHGHSPDIDLYAAESASRGGVVGFGRPTVSVGFGAGLGCWRPGAWL